MSKLNSLIFDVDGTLADTEREGHRIAFNMAFSDAGLDWCWSEELYGKLLTVAGGKERIHFFIERYCPEFLHDDESVALIKHLHHVKTVYYTQLVTEGKIRPRPGVIRLIQEARDAGMRLAIATTSAPKNAIALLKTILHPTAPDWFEIIAAGDIVAAKKPAPDIYQYVLQKMNLSPEECLVFEDSAHGLQAAAHTGLPTIVTLNGYTRTQDFSDALLVLSHLGEPNNPAVLIDKRIELSKEFSQSPTRYVDLAFLREVHQQALKSMKR